MSRLAFISCLWRERFIEEIGVCYLKTIIKEKGNEVKIFYKWPKDKEKVFLDVIDYNPDIVGFSLSHKHTGIEPIIIGAEIIKRSLPDVHITCGGVFATFNAKNILEKCKNLDSVMLGEAELTIKQFVSTVVGGGNLSEIDGLAYRRKDGSVKINPKTKMILDLDSIKFPDRGYIDEYLQNDLIKIVNMVGSRGCHGKCHFCNVPSMYSFYGEGKRWRGRSIKNIVDELEYLNKSHGISVFSFGDSSFEDADPITEGKNRLREFSNEILKRNLKIFYSCCFRAETFKDNKKDNALISLMVKSGLYNILIGVEAGNRRALESFAKKANVDDNVHALNLFSKYPIYISKGFIMFTPHSNYETLKENLEFAHKIKLTEEFIYLTTIAAVFNGTLFVKDLQNESLLDIDYDWENEYPFRWVDKNAKKLAFEMLKIRQELMKELEFSQYYGRSNIILERITGDKIYREMQYRKWKTRELREKMGVNGYEFFKNCLELIKNGWEQDIYEELKEGYIYRNFKNIIAEMELETKKFNRLLKQGGHNIETLIKNFV